MPFLVRWRLAGCTDSVETDSCVWLDTRTRTRTPSLICLTVSRSTAPAAREQLPAWASSPAQTMAQAGRESRRLLQHRSRAPRHSALCSPLRLPGEPRLRHTCNGACAMRWYTERLPAWIRRAEAAQARQAYLQPRPAAVQLELQLKPKPCSSGAALRCTTLCRFKCFVQGVVYGLNLKADALRSRGTLRSALQASLDDETYTASIEDRMTVVFIDDAGQISEFGPSAGDSKWASLAPRVRRVYVSPAS